MHEFKLPDIGEGISEAKLVQWFVEVGDEVEDGADVATISTDKVDVELPAPVSGRVAELCWKPGETVQVGQVLMRIEGEGAKAAVKEEAEAKLAEPAKASPGERSNGGAEPKGSAGPVVAAPALRRLAKEQGIDLESVQGSGPGGRILKRDLEAAHAPAAKAPPPAQTPPAQTPPAKTPKGGTRREKLPPVRAVAAERLSYSARTLATSTLAFEVNGDGVLALLERLKPEAERRAIKLTPLALLAKCVAAALERHERFNATIDEEAQELVLHEVVNLGVAVAAPGKLLVPVLRDVRRLSLFETAEGIAALAEKVRSERLLPADMQDGTFSLSSTGGLERTTFTAAEPIVNPPQSAILWVSRISTRPRVRNEQLEAGPVMAMSLAFDHRFIDGAEATACANDIAALVETPEWALA